MSVTVRIDNRVETECGMLETGRIYSGSRDCVFQREVPRAETDDHSFILETGLTAGLGSMACMRSAAVEAGHVAIAVAHTHHDREHPIRANAEDIEMVTDALAGEQKSHFVGLSRGWPDTVLALQHMPGKAESATAVAPAMMDRIHPERLLLLFAETTMEMVHHPKEFPRVMVDCLRTTTARLGETLAEAAHLAIGDIQHRVHRLKQHEQPPALHMFASRRDGFFSDSELMKIAHRLGFDSFNLFSEGVAGHGALAVHKNLARQVIARATEQTDK